MRKAQDDLSAGKAILSGTLSSYEMASFHAQQAAEKSIKALLVRHQIHFGKTHDLRELLETAEQISPGITTALAEVHQLTPYGVPARYPGDITPASAEDARRHLALAQRALEHVSPILDSYLRGGAAGA